MLTTPHRRLDEVWRVHDDLGGKRVVTYQPCRSYGLFLGWERRRVKVFVAAGGDERPRDDLKNFCCLNDECSDFGQRGLNNLRVCFCWPVRTLRVKVGRNKYEKRTPAMAAGLTDHIGTMKEWLTRPAFRWNKDD